MVGDRDEAVAAAAIAALEVGVLVDENTVWLIDGLLGR